jgi:vacuolar-type H+-ATPase subunit I/STV1
MVVIDNSKETIEKLESEHNFECFKYMKTIGARNSRIKELEEALREIDTHIRSTSEPIPYIVETLKKTLPEYED